MGNVNRVMELLQKNQKEMLEIENTVAEMKNVFDGFISRLDMIEERISELENTSKQTNKKTLKTKTKKKLKRISKDCETTTKV